MKTKLFGTSLAWAVIGLSSLAYADTVGFLYSGGSLTNFNVPGAIYTEGFGINNGGNVVGSYIDPATPGGFHSGFLYSGGSYTTLNAPGVQQTIPFGINSSGQVVGYTNKNFGLDSSGFLYNGVSFTNLTVPGAVGTWAYGINGSGLIVGAYLDGSGTHGFSYNGSYSTLNVPSATSNVASGVDGNGDILLQSNLGSFLYNSGSYTALNVPGAIYTQGFGINNNGDVLLISDLGYFLYSGGSYAAISLPSGLEAFGINDDEQIVGRNDNVAATPLPTTLPLFASGLCALGLMGWRRRRKMRTTCVRACCEN